MNKCEALGLKLFKVFVGLTIAVVWLIAIIIFLGTLATITGCSVYWTDHVFIATVCKEIKAGEVLLIADANELYIGAERPESKTDKVTVITPGVVVKSE